MGESGCPLTTSQPHIPTYVFGVNKIFHHDFVLFSFVDIAAQMAPRVFIAGSGAIDLVEGQGDTNLSCFYGI